ncbi:unnamed protein product [Schistosoma margrebowiei]|uniref:Uncharacterized protein n=1 Tax=Schistosoma margrebowiei TaxID=48269 RepID=A0A183NAF7_9TREM|nr:unnamed protein product [Schistosoma margrebowiei]
MTCYHSFLKIVLHLVFSNYSTIKSVSDVNYKLEILNKSFAANNNNTYTNSNTTKCPGVQIYAYTYIIPQAKCNIGKLSSLQQDNIVLNAHEVLTTRDDEETVAVNEALNLESNEALLALSNSEKKLQPEQHYGSRDIGRES